jgi:S1-C subfamily serine protease
MVERVESERQELALRLEHDPFEWSSQNQMKSTKLHKAVAESFIFLCVAALTCWVGTARAQLTTNVLLRVRMIRPAGSSSFGTGFTLEVDGSQYLVTAKHVVAGMKDSDTLEIRQGDQWTPLTVKVLRANDADIAVLIPPRQLTVSFPLEPSLTGIRLPQDVYFLGFPYGLPYDLPTKPLGLIQGFALPFIKKGVVSAMTDHAKVIFLDGHNNPGFSDGPIVFRDLDQSEVVFKLAAVVSGFRPELLPILKLREITPDKVSSADIAQQRIVRKEGHLYRLDDTDEVVNSNTGIVIRYNIGYALDLIHKNPIGPKVSQGFKP